MTELEKVDAAPKPAPEGRVRSGRVEAIKAEILKRIASGAYAQSGRLPSERQFCEEFAAARVTLHEILIHLEAEGLIYREKQRGWYVSPPRFVYNPQSRGHFALSAIEQGRTPSTAVIDKRIVPAPSGAAELLGIAPGSKIARIRRVRSVDGRPILYVEHYFLPHVFPNLFDYDLSVSLTELYREKYNFHYARMRYQITPTAVRDDAAKVLRVVNGNPALLVRRVNYARDVGICDCDFEYWRHDAVLVEVDVDLGATSMP